MFVTENTVIQFEIESSTENNTDSGLSTSEESEEDFNYIALPNPPFCGKNKKHSKTGIKILQKCVIQ